jgi:hypothetical protein
MSRHTSLHMKWHAQGRTKDGLLSHPADGEALKALDSRYPIFTSDPRNVRLGLASILLGTCPLVTVLGRKC